MLDASPLIFKDTATALDEAQSKLQAVAWLSFLGARKPSLLHIGRAQKVGFISQGDWGTAENWFVLGDIHGDFYALYNALKYIQQSCPDFRLVFLGDLVDRGPHPLECLWLLLAYAERFPNRIMWIGGNHDVSIQKGPDGSFFSTVAPAEFLKKLNNADEDKVVRQTLGDEFIELAKDLPRAALSPDGVLFTHGGFPLTDRHAELLTKKTNEEQMDWLNSDGALQDFTWTRITPRPKKIPNRQSMGCSYGYADFAAFCEATKQFFPIKRLVNGHEHPTNGFDLHPEWKPYPAITFKGFGFANDYDNPDSYITNYQANLVVGRCRKDDVPEIINIPVDQRDLTNFFETKITEFFREIEQEVEKIAPPTVSATEHAVALRTDQLAAISTSELLPSVSGGLTAIGIEHIEPIPGRGSVN